MQIIKKLSDMIEDELEGAEEYIKCALKHKEEHPQLAKVFNEISTEEMRHVNLLHEQVAKIIQDYRKEHGDPPAPMLAVYDYLHEKHIDKAAKIRAMQMQFRGMPD